MIKSFYMPPALRLTASVVSGNKHLLDVKKFQGIKIVTARQILEILGV